MTINAVEDDAVLREGLCELLTAAGYSVHSARSLREARELAGGDLWLIDVMLADGSGLTLCRELREKSSVPIIILTALDAEDSVIEGLSAGADDYVVKPFRSGELMARIAAHLRRTPAKTGILRSGELTYDEDNETVAVNGVPLRLRRAERRLLGLLLKSGGRLLRRDYLLYALWDEDESFVDENTLSVLVSRLRHELRTADADEIETVRGVGYRWTGRVTR